MAENDYALQPLEELVSKQLEPAGKSRDFKYEKGTPWEEMKYYALLPLVLYCVGRGVYGLIMNNYEAALRLGDALRTAMEFLR